MPAPKKNKRTQAQRREESQGRILDASLRLLAERGYDRFSLQDIGQAAGCSYELVNHYFGNKEGLLLAIVDHIMATLETITPEETGLPPGFENLAELIRHFAAPVDKNLLTFTSYMRLAAEAPFDNMLLDLISRRGRQTRSKLSEAIKAGQFAGELRPDIDPKEIADVIYKFLRGHADVSLLRRAEGQRPRAATQATNTVEAFIEMLRVALGSPRRSGRAGNKGTTSRPKRASR